MYKIFFYIIIASIVFTGCSSSKAITNNQDYEISDTISLYDLRMSTELSGDINLMYNYYNDSSYAKYLIAEKMYNEHFFSNQIESASNILDLNIKELIMVRHCSYIENSLTINITVRNDTSIVLNKDYKAVANTNNTSANFEIITDTIISVLKKDLKFINDAQTSLFKEIENTPKVKNRFYYPKLLRFSLSGEVSKGGVENVILTNSYELFFWKHISGEFGMEFTNYFTSYSAGINYYFGCREGFFLGASKMNYRYELTSSEYGGSGSLGGYTVWKIKGGYYYRINRFFGVKANLFYGISDDHYKNKYNEYESLIPFADKNFFGANLGLSFNL